MLNRLQQQLVEAGLAQPDQARPERSRGSAHKGKSGGGGKKAARSPAERTAKAKPRQKKPDPEVRAQVRALVAAHRLPIVDGAEVGFNFQVGTRIRRIHVSSEQHRALVAGELAVLALDGRHSLLAAEHARAVGALEPNRVVYLNESRPDSREHGDGDHPVPDDLMW